MTNFSNQHTIIMVIANLYLVASIITQDLIWVFASLIWGTFAIITYFGERRMFRMDCKIEGMQRDLDQKRWENLYTELDVIKRICLPSKIKTRRKK